MKKRFCSRPYCHLHFDPDGNVRLCAWMDIPIGNILNEDVKEIWHGEKAEELRASFADGSFRFCRKTSCPFLENDSLEYVDEAEYNRRAITEILPKAFNVANDFVCNHKCPSCREHIYVPDEDYLARFDKAAKIIVPLLNQAEMFSACGNGDLFASPHMLEMLSSVYPENKRCRVEIETNGALFDEKHWSRIAHWGEYELSVAVTPNSFNEHTYKYLNGNVDDFRHMLDNLHFIRDLHEKKIINHLEISMVVQEKNYQEFPAFARRCIEDFGADRVVVKPLYNWFKMSDEDFWFKDVLNPLHPYHESWKEMMKDSIFENPHVYLWGARNVHKSMRHPAYRFEDMIKGVSILSEMEELGTKLRKFMDIHDGKTLVLYGDNELTGILVKFLKGRVPLRIMARDVSRKSIRNVDVEHFCSTALFADDVVVVLNFNKFDQVKRDFDFEKFAGELLTFPDWVQEMQRLKL